MDFYISLKKNSFDDIRNSDQYIWGYATSEDYDMANKHALDNLISKISVHVDSSFEYIAKETNDDFSEYAKWVINTYSNTTLTNAKELNYEKRGDIYILRYIDYDELDKIFKHRENKINDYIR